METSVWLGRAATKPGSGAITTDQLRKRYRDGVEALRGVDLQVNRGELFGLIGPDGAGKSTALKILAGVMRQTSGQAQVLGRQPRKVRHLVGFVTQDFSLYPDLTIEENLRYEAGVQGVPEDVYAARRNTYLRGLGLAQFTDRLAGRLSGGMKRKLALCAALILNPRLLLLDEPTTGLDPVSRSELWEMLAAAGREEVTTVVATPYLLEAERCDRIALLYEGQIRMVGTPDELRARLGLHRLELRSADLLRLESAIRELLRRGSSQIVDLYTFGDRLDVLVKSIQAAEAELREALAEAHLPLPAVQPAEPTLDNVFSLVLRKEGLHDYKPPEFPKLALRAPAAPGAARDSAPAAQPAISARNLSRRFNHFLAVDNVNLNVDYGEIYGLLGANGAGKTTTVKMLCGLVEPTAGQALLSGEQALSRSSSLLKRIGYMSQKFTLYDTLTVLENLEFYSTVYEIPRGKRREKIDWALQACGLMGMQKTIVERLPLGWKQRIAFGASVMHEPDILILDEPTAGVDPIARRQLWNLIRDFARDGAAVLVTTHYLEEAEYCTRLGIMTRGRIVKEGSPGQIKGSKPGGPTSLEEAFVAIVKGSEEDG